MLFGMMGVGFGTGNYGLLLDVMGYGEAMRFGQGVLDWVRCPWFCAGKTRLLGETL